jgi:hypothetical protein
MGLSGFSSPNIIDHPVSGHADSPVGINACTNQEITTDVTTPEKDFRIRTVAF